MKAGSLALSFLLLGSAVCAAPATVGQLALEVPGDLKPQVLHHVDSTGGETNLWQADSGRSLEVLYFGTPPKSPGGPMTAASEEAIEVAGQKTKLIETEMYNGLPKKVLLVYLRVGAATYRICGQRMPRADFLSILKSITATKQMPNQSSEPTSSSATPPAEQELRPR